MHAIYRERVQILSFALAGLSLLLCENGCRHIVSLAPPEKPMLSVEQRRELQTHVYAAPLDVVFAATIAVFQDLGWTLETVDKPSGLIRVSTVKRPDSFGPEDEQDYDVQRRREMSAYRADPSKKWMRWREAVVHMEPWDQGTRQRIVLNLQGALPAMSYRERERSSTLRRGREVEIHAPPAEQTVEVALPEAYRDLFARIEAAVQQRMSMRGEH
jgi:hypothetical protein